MGKGFFASCLVMITAAGLGYWLCADSALLPRPTLKLKETIRTKPVVAEEAAQEPERYVAGRFVELIDLSTVYEPTGQELALQMLLGSIDDTETLGMPRTFEAETLPPPRLFATNAFSDASEEASSPPSQLEIIRRRVSLIMVEKFAEILSEMQPLKGSVPAPVEYDDEN